LSTKFTESVSSQVLETPLVQLLADAHSWVLTSLVRLMMDKGHTSLTGKDLVFFSHLDCGITQASAVARRMGVTRQAVYKSTKHLQIIGALELAADPDDQRQKVISMTPMGEKIALDARASLAEIEGYLASTVGGASLKQCDVQTILLVPSPRRNNPHLSGYKHTPNRYNFSGLNSPHLSHWGCLLLGLRRRLTSGVASRLKCTNLTSNFGLDVIWCKARLQRALGEVQHFILRPAKSLTDP